MYGSALKKRLAKSKTKRHPTGRKIKSAKRRITRRMAREMTADRGLQSRGTNVLLSTLSFRFRYLK